MDVLHQIGIRWPLLVMQLVGFLLVFGILKVFLFGRIHKVLADRAAEEEARKHAISGAKKAFDEARSRLDARQSELDKQAYEKTQAEVRSGLKRKSDLTSAALDKARTEVTSVREGLAADHASALDRLKADVVSLALFVASRAAGKSLEDSASRAVAEREVAATLAARTGGKA